MKGLELNELKENKLYRCQLSGLEILITSTRRDIEIDKLHVFGTYFFEGNFKSIEISKGQLVDLHGN